MSLRKAAFGAAAMSAVGVFRLAAQFLAVPLLARLISPHEYGLVAIAMPFVLFGLLIADSGIGQSLVRTAKDEHAEWSSCFWLSVALGGCLALILAIVAPFVARFYGEAELLSVILVLALVILGQSIALVPGAALQQAKRFGALALVDLVSVMAGILTAVWLALHGAGVWALVAQQVALYLFRLLGYLYFTPIRPSLVFVREKVWAHVLFGRDVLGVNLITFLGRTGDSLILGRVLGSVLVGYYSMAFLFLRLPSQIIMGPLHTVLYAQLAPHHKDVATVRSTYLLFTRLVACLVFPAMGMVAVAHKPLFALILSEKWAFSGEVFLIAAPAAALQAVMSMMGTTVIALGRAELQLRSASESTVLLLLAVFAASHFGLLWTAYAFFAAVILYWPRQLAINLPALECSPLQFARCLMLPFIVTIAAALAYTAVDAGHDDFGNWTLAFIAAALGVAALSLSVLLQLGSLRESVRSLRTA